MKISGNKLFGAAFVAILLLCMFTILPVARGQPPAPSFWVEPTTENFTTTNASVGSQFKVTVCGSCLDQTVNWAVRLGFDSSELHAVAGYMSDFFAGHACTDINPEIDNNAGNVFAAEILGGSDYVGPTTGSLFNVTFEIVAAPGPGQSLTSLIDPAYGIASGLTAFGNISSYLPEEPLSTAPCTYTFCDNAVSSSNPTSVSCSPNPARAGSPVTCIAAVSSPNATGTVTWTSSSSTGFFDPTVCSLSAGNSSQSCATIYTDSSPGTVIITACYSGDSSNTPSNGSTILVVGQSQQSSTYIFVRPGTAHTGEDVSCSAEVIGDKPTGTVAWSSNSSTGTFSPSVCPLSTYGACATDYTDDSSGTVMIFASYSGDFSNTPSNCSTTLMVSAQAVPSSTYVYCSYRAAPVNGSVDCNAYVSGFNPTGNVTWTTNSSSGSFSSTVCDLTYGNCFTTYTDSSPGTVIITASYSGDADNAPSNGSAILVVSAQPVPSSTYVYCQYRTIPVNGSVSCSADVSGFNPTGNVTWSSNSTTGSFSSTVSALSYGYSETTYVDSSPGTVIITASYSGDVDNAPSNGTMTLVVSSQPVPSSTYVYCSYNIIPVNGSVGCSASVAGFDPTGNVTWTTNSSSGSFSSSVCGLSYGNCATIYTDSSAYTVLITASYSGDADNAPSNCSTTLVVSAQGVPSSTYVYCSYSVAPVNGSVDCTAEVQGYNIPTGNVTWSSNSTTGSFSSPVSALSDGRWSYTTYTDSSPGTVIITACYSGDADNAPSNGSTTLVVSSQPVPSSTQIFSTYSKVPINASVSFIAEVWGFDTPTGNVTWSCNSTTGSFSSSVCALSYGECSTTYNDSAAGTVLITACYSGDSSNAPSNCTITLVVSAQRVQSGIDEYCWPTSPHVNGYVTCNAWVSGLDPTGNVTWSSNSTTGSFSSSICALSYGECSTTYTDSSTGSVTITACYSGDSFNAPSNTSTVLVVVQKTPSSTYVYCSRSTIHVGQSVSCSAEVSGFNVPTGNVTWSSNSTTGSFSSPVCDLIGECFTTYTDSSPGTVIITASYSGDADNAPSNGSTTLVVSSQPVPSSTYVYCQYGTIHVNGPALCMAWVDGFNPTGTVTWTTNSTTGSFSSSVCTLSYATCTTYYTDSSAGTVVITACYSGDANNVPSNSSMILVVSAQSLQSSIYVSCLPNPVPVNGPVTCNAWVNGFDPTGNVTWSSNSTTGSFSSPVCALSNEECSTIYNDSSVGTVLITACYSGDTDNTPSNITVVLVVNTQIVQSSTYVSCSPNPVHVNWVAYCSAFISGDSPTGTVVWSCNSTTGSFSSSVCTLVNGYCATFYTDSSVGTVIITACYGGDSFDTPSNSSVTLVVNTQAEPTSTYVYTSSSSAYANWPVMCTATVSGYNPTGTVTWSSSSATGSFSPSVSTLSYGTCSTNYNDSSPGTVIITASYSGDASNAMSSGSITLTLSPEPVLPSEVLINVPYHHQVNGYYCGPAALEEVFNYYGPDIDQDAIASVARTTPAGTYDIDLVRAAEFSNLSSSSEGQAGSNSSGFNGYPGRSLGYAALSCYGMSVEDLRAVLAAGYPVIVLTTWHFRVAVGYDDNDIIFQDPYYGSLYEMTYDAFSLDWDYSGHEGILVCPWQIEISNPRNLLPGDTFNVTATITYPVVYPFQALTPTSEASSVNATITLPSGLALTAGETAQKACESYIEPGQSFTVSWQVNCQSLGDYRIGVEAEGLVSGNMMAEPPTYPQSYSYQDRIGGTNDNVVAVTTTLDTIPPVTKADYDGSWQNKPFAINLTATDDNSGVLQTYYRINGGQEQTLTVNGEPIINTSGANNTLEFWSVDWAGNEELPHNFLTNIKLDATPPSLDDLSFTPFTDIQPNQAVEATVSATDDISGVKNVTLLYSTDNGFSWISQTMTLNQSTLLYGAAVPGQPFGTRVRLYVEAYGQAGNFGTLTNEYYYFAYVVGPLSVTNIAACSYIYRGQTAYIRVTVSDVGDFPENVWVTLYYNLTADKTVDAYPVLLEPGQGCSLLFSWNTAGIPCLNYTLTAVATIPAGNVTLSGGTISLRMMGDVNGDGRVDMKDIAMIARAFGSTPTSPRWNPNADLNGDGTVNMRDIALVARHFGQHYP